MGRRFERGLLIHRLLQSLPDLAPERRRASAARFLALALHGLDAEAQRSILDETMAVLEHPECAPFFAADSAAEVPVVGLVGGRPLAGQIDRLVVRPGEVLILDYKSLRPAPESPDEVPAIYLDQLAAYARAVGAVYPGRKVRAAILWTDGPRLMAIEEGKLGKQLPA
jgi:ATP-dependent helicase/nuclease subunit A